MGRVWCIACLLACTPGSRHEASPEPDASIDASEVDAFNWIAENRLPSSVIVGSNRILWSRGTAGCLDLGCPDDLTASTVLSSELTPSAATTLVKSEEGIRIVGNDSEVFYSSRAGASGWVVTRLRIGAGAPPEAMSIPRSEVSALAVDATYVYWFEAPIGGPSAIRRASRAGDGSDAITLATDILRPYRLTIFGGYVFFDQDKLVSGALHSIVDRVPITGGTPAQVTTDMDWDIVAVDDSVMYVTYPSGNAPPYPHRIVTMTADGTIQQTLVDDLPQYYTPGYTTVLDRGELFWNGSGTLFRMPTTGGAPSSLGSVGYDPFGVTADSVAFDFTMSGYTTIPR